MNHEALDRLLRSAAQAQPAARGDLASEPPFGFATRVVAQWRALPGLGADRSAAAALWFRRVFLCSCAVAVLSVAWSFQVDTAPANDELALASYDASADLP